MQPSPKSALTTIYICRTGFNRGSAKHGLMMLAAILLGAISSVIPGFSAHAETINITNADARAGQSLDGEWAYIVDPVAIGDTSILGTPNKDGFFNDAKARGPGDLLEYDFDVSPALTIPGTWTEQKEDLKLYEGTIWLRRRFVHNSDPARRYLIHFGAVNYHAKVYLNGKLLGEHEGGFTPFSLEATQALRDGDNSLVVRVEAERRADRLPALRMDWWNYGGITRSVRLLDMPATFVRNYTVKLGGSSDARTIEIEVEADGAAPAEVMIAIPELGLARRLQLQPGGRQNISLSPECLDLWSPENPRLYDVTLRTGDDVISDRVGFRTIQTAGRKLLLNGRPLYLRGISIHDERLGAGGGRIRTRDEAAALLDKVEELGANFIRLAHYPHNEHMLREADERGLLVWAELPIYWGIDWTNPATLASAKRQFEEMKRRDQNRAAIIIWSIANETARSSERLTFLTELAAHVRSLDNTRLLSAALLPDYSEAAIGKLVGTVTRLAKGEPVDTYPIMLDDPLGEVVDIVSVNMYYGWYYARPISLATGIDPGTIRDAELQLVPKIRLDNIFAKPMVLSEFGAGAIAGRRGDAEAVWTEDYQARLYRAHLGLLLANPNLQGVSPWVLKDFRSPMRPLTGVQDYWNRKGIISATGDQKLAFDVLKFMYRAYETQMEMVLPPAPTCKVF